MERDEETLEPRDYYAKLPRMEGRRALVLDPMLATGGSGSAAIAHVKAHANPTLDLVRLHRGGPRRASRGSRPTTPRCRSSPGRSIGS